MHRGIPDFTVVCAVDAEHVEELAVSYPTWSRLSRRPFLFIVDPDAPQAYDRLLDIYGSGFSAVSVAQRPHSSQREKMLAGLVFEVAEHVETPYYLKVDTDAICDGPANWNLEDGWIDERWFEGEPAIIGQKWGYTKPWRMLEDLDVWAAGKPEFASAPPLARTVAGDKAKHPRIISYCMFGRTDFTKKMAGLAGDWLPVPSQDSYLGYCCTRLGETMVRTRMPGWRHVGGGGRRLREAAAEAMKG